MSHELTFSHIRERDIDLLLVFKKENNQKINSVIKEKNEILTKRIHPIKQTNKDLTKNIKEKDKVILSAMRDGIVDYELLKMLKQKDEQQSMGIAKQVVFSFNRYETDIESFRSLRKQILTELSKDY